MPGRHRQQPRDEQHDVVAPVLVPDQMLEYVLRETLRIWSGRVEDGMDEETFMAAARYDVSQVDSELVEAYDEAAPFWHHYRGLERYGRKRREEP